MVDWRSVAFALAVCVLYVPMVYLGVNTFFPELPENTCYLSVKHVYSPYAPPYALPECNCTAAEGQAAAQAASETEMRECDAAWQQKRREAEAGRYVGIMVISLVGSIALLLKLEKSITSGMFIGVVVTAFIGTVRYIETRTVAGFALLVALFLIVIAYIQRQRKIV